MSSPLTNLAWGLTSWIQFEFCCVRGYSFSERYFAKPLHEILASSYPSYVPRSEWVHPYLKPKEKRRGPKEKIDMAVVDNNGKESGSVFKAALEMKWCGATLPKVEDVLWDLYRLALVHRNSPTTECYFVLAGITGRVSEFLQKTDQARMHRGVQGSFLRISKGGGRFRALKFNQFAPDLQSKLIALSSAYRPTPVSIHTIPVKQPEIIRHSSRDGNGGATVLVVRIEAGS